MKHWEGIVRDLVFFALLPVNTRPIADTKRETNVKKLGSGTCILFWLISLALSPRAVAQVIQVSNVEELYSAVNDSANAGAAIVLSSGIYMLSALDPNGVPRPKGGR